MKSVYLNVENNICRNRFTKIFIENDYSISNTPENADIILFGGGLDINPKLYNQKPHKKTYFSDDRDNRDVALFKKYMGKPMIGICRGAQLGHVLSGGYLIQDINNHMSSHDVDVGGTIVNFSSDHHQAMSDQKIGDILGIAKVSTSNQIVDDTGNVKDLTVYPKCDIEIMYHPHTKFYAMQSHPEYIENVQAKSIFFNHIKAIFR